MAEALSRANSGATDELYLTEPLKGFQASEPVMFSGGVGEYVYGRGERDFGISAEVGLALRRRLEEGRFPWRVLPAGECIPRDCVRPLQSTGVQLSGNTVYARSRASCCRAKNAGAPAPGAPRCTIEAGAVRRRHTQAPFEPST